MGDGVVVSAREHGGRFIGPYFVLQRHADAWACFSRGASADRIHDHQDRAIFRRDGAIDIGGCAGFFHAIAREVFPHGNQQLLWIWHLN